MRRRERPLIPYPRSRIRPAMASVRPIQKFPLYWKLWMSWRWQRSRSETSEVMQAIERQSVHYQPWSNEALAIEYRALCQRPDGEGVGTHLPLWGLILNVMHRRLGFWLRSNQIEAALALIRGEVVELRTGEGKTLAAQLAALIAASAGVSVHVVTVNDYLAERDYRQLQPIADWLGISVGLLRANDERSRRVAYASDIVYANNKTLVFDALRDQADRRAKKGLYYQRSMGQIFAIIDEADSVLIDDATVPMILSEVAGSPPDADFRLFTCLFECLRDLDVERFASLDGQGWWRLNTAGRSQLASALMAWGEVSDWSEDLVRLAEDALYALHGLHENVHYVVRDHTVSLIDRSTGRLAADRKWSYGLQQFVELKSGVPLTGETRQIEQMTQQRFFRRYHTLSGLTGTAQECKSEFWAIYGLVVHSVAPHRPPRVKNMGFQVFPTDKQKWQAVVQDALIKAKTEQAVLIGVNDVQSSQALSAMFEEAKYPVSVLDALSEAEEASLIEQAGQPGCITIATHLAGRGTDIAVAPIVLANGGLHVMIAGLMESSRLDRQLSGRTGRQGAEGSFSYYLSLEDRQWRDGLTDRWRFLINLGLRTRFPVRWLKLVLQQAKEHLNRNRRIMTLFREQRMAQQLGYDRE